jgi:hypothetical protein
MVQSYLIDTKLFHASEERALAREEAIALARAVRRAAKRSAWQCSCTIIPNHVMNKILF